MKMTGSRGGWLYHCLTRASNYTPNFQFCGKLHKIVGLPDCNWGSHKTVQRIIRTLVVSYGRYTICTKLYSWGFHRRLHPRWISFQTVVPYAPDTHPLPMFSQRPIPDLFMYRTKHVQCSVARVLLWHFSYAFPSRVPWGPETKLKRWIPSELEVDTDGCSTTKPKAICSFSTCEPLNSFWRKVLSSPTRLQQTEY